MKRELAHFLTLTLRYFTAASYVAPEVLKNAPYDQAVDMWSIGVILYVLLCGYPPFVDENQTELFRKIRMSEWKFPGEDWDSVSEEAKDLIRGLLVANPVQRLTAQQALQSDWLRKEGESPTDTEPTMIEESLNQRKSRLKKAVKAFVRKTASGDATKHVAAVKQVHVEVVPNPIKQYPRRDLGPEQLRKFEI
jgi:serine/threonine protein kinase